MPSQAETIFLEDWLRASAGDALAPTPHPCAPASARAILQAWAELRDPALGSHPDRLLAALATLSSSGPSLHVADPQAKLLLSLLSSPSPLPHPCLPYLYKLLYAWLRKSPRPSPSLLSSAASFLSNPLTPSSPPSFLLAYKLLLLGALSAVPSLPPASLKACLDLFCRILEENRAAIGSFEELVPELLASIGYALSKSDGEYFRRILGFLLGIWGAGAGLRPSLRHGLMVMRLVEWVVMGFIDLRAFDRIEILCEEISVEKCEVRGYSRFSALMAAAGVLRAFRMAGSSSGIELSPRLRSSLEGSIASVANYVVSGARNGHELDVSIENRLLLQCISLGLARCGSISFNAAVLQCLCLSLLNEIFPLKIFFKMAAEDPNGGSVVLRLSKVKEHLASVLFKEAGAVTAVLCNQYASAHEGSKTMVESYMWEYCRELYMDLRMASLVLRGRNDELLGNLEKVAEAAFLMAVVFAAEVAKHKLNPKSNEGVQPDASVKILVAFSCIEYLRRVRLPEYTDAVRQAVLTIQENAACTTSFVESMPSYVEVTNQSGSFSVGGAGYIWSEDEVQTARILFYLRVIPTCISLIPASIFGRLVVSTMFLYMLHPNGKVARASHSVFVAFISSGKDSEQDDRTALKEQLVFYYIQRTLEGYPGITPFEGLASGVAAVIRHLPAGSPGIFYCVHSVVDKAKDLCGKAIRQDANMWKTWEGNSEPYKKVIELLLRLISLVDVQVLPYLLKQSAEFIVQLPKDGQNVLLDEMYSHVAESDDVTRKPVLVSWVQSLSYVCSQKKPLSSTSAKSASTELQNDSVSHPDDLNLMRTVARL